MNLNTDLKTLTVKLCVHLTCNLVHRWVYDCRFDRIFANGAPKRKDTIIYVVRPETAENLRKLCTDTLSALNSHKWLTNDKNRQSALKPLSFFLSWLTCIPLYVHKGGHCAMVKNVRRWKVVLTVLKQRGSCKNETKDNSSIVYYYNLTLTNQ